MRYDLLNSNRGILIDRTPIMQDIKDTFEVSFLVKPRTAYVALFTGEDGAEYKEVIKDGRAKLPKQLLGKEQYVGLIVSEIDGERVVRSWECEPLRITAFLYLRQTQWQVSGGMTDKDVFSRFAELEKNHAQTLDEFAALETVTSQHRDETAALVAEFNATLSRQAEALASAQNNNEQLAAAYNTAITVINDLSGRIAALEKNYDPTLIK